jgi:hypothetical protein
MLTSLNFIFFQKYQFKSFNINILAIDRSLLNNSPSPFSSTFSIFKTHHNI